MSQRLLPALLFLLPTLATTWSTCAFPKVNWIANDIGRGTSGYNSRVTGMGDFTYAAGTSRGNTTIKSSASPTTITRVGSEYLRALIIAQISSTGTPTNLWKWQTTSSMGATFKVVQPMTDNVHLAIGLETYPGNVSLNDGNILVNPLESLSYFSNDYNIRMGAAIKFRPSDGAVLWTKRFLSARGSRIRMTSGDSSGNMVRSRL